MDLELYFDDNGQMEQLAEFVKTELFKKAFNAWKEGAQMPTAEPAGLKPASDPPENTDEVLVCTKSKKGARNWDKGYYFDGRWVHRGTAEVTHWMPMPELPKEE